MNAWQIIQRQNKAALAIGSASASIPAEVAPTVSAFYVHHIYGEPVPETPATADTILATGTVYFYFEFSNPDGLPIEFNITGFTDGWATIDELLAAGVLVRCGSGWLWEATVPAYNYAFTHTDITLNVRWQDLDEDEHFIDTVADPNIELSAGWPEASAGNLPSGTVIEGVSECFVGASCYDPPNLLDAVTVDWGE